MTFEVIGAFDRFNYGDILFAHIARHLIAEAHPRARIAFRGLRAADLTPEGGVAVERLRRSREPRVLFVAGGEVLSARWHQMAEHLMSLWQAQQFRRLRHRVGPGWADRLAAGLLDGGMPRRLPWLFPSAPGAAVVYNAVGGCHLDKLPEALQGWARTALAQAAWVSVRDSATRDLLAMAGGPAPRLSPDSAVIMRELIAGRDLEHRRARLMARIGLPGPGYVAVQVALPWLTGTEEALAAAFGRLHARTGLPLVAFAIGRAAGHEDQVAARRLAARLGPVAWFRRAPEDLDILDIMALIAGAACYAGTSLHGYITALAFGRPRLGLHPGVRKLALFHDDWDLATLPGAVAPAELPAAAEAAMAHGPQALAAQAGRLAGIYRADLRAMWHRLDGILPGSRAA